MQRKQSRDTILKNDIYSIALFGGNFDPVHTGHIQVAETILKKMSIDELWFVPASMHPHKEKTMFSFEERISKLKQVTEHESRFRVYENDVPSLEDEHANKSYTIYLIEKLKKTYPDYKFYFVIGADNVTALKTWHRYEELLEQIDFIVIDRKVTDKHIWKTLPYYKKLHFVKMPKINISSTEIRNKINKNT